MGNGQSDSRIPAWKGGCYARRMRAGLRFVFVGLFVLGLVSAAVAQRQSGRYRRSGRDPVVDNVPYDGRFTFVRVKYATAPGGYWAGQPSWSHGYPLAEGNLVKIMNDISFLGPLDHVNVLALDDPELFKYPVAYLIEPGWWTLTDSEAAALRAYMEKGGFVIVDDFKMLGWRGLTTGGWEPFAANMRRVLPDVRFIDMDLSHPVFHCFFDIRDLTSFPQAYNAGRPIFRGVFEDNDPRKRLMMAVNYNTDISQYWEWSGRGFRSVVDTNEAYKLGVNYLVYGVTH
jgi:hypothetical protein